MEEQQQQMNIDLKNTQKLEFDGQVLVGEGFVLRKVSKFVTGQDEDGIMPNLSALRGSQSLSQLSDICVALSRDLQGEDRNITKLSVLQNRFSGDTGIASHLEYCTKTGRLTETTIKGEF